MGPVLQFILLGLLSRARSEIEDIQVIYRIHQPLHPESDANDVVLASQEIHLRTNSLGKLLRNSTDSYFNPSVGLHQFHCGPVTANCSWIEEGKGSVLKNIIPSEPLTHFEVSPEVKCSINNGGCQMYCREEDEGPPVCSCPDQYSLNPDKKTCNGTDPDSYVLSGLSGEFSSPNYPSAYGDNLLVSWILVVPVRFRIILDFDNFRTESCCDILDVYDGLDASSPKIGTFSGNGLPNQIKSTGNVMYLTFKTDGSSTSDGFSIKYKTESGEQEGLYLGENGSLMSQQFVPADVHLCVSMIYKSEYDRSYPWMVANLDTGDILSLMQTIIFEHDGWKIGRFKGELEPAQMGTPLKLSVHFPAASNVFSIMGCNPYDDEDVYLGNNTISLNDLEKPLIPLDFGEAYEPRSSESHSTFSTESEKSFTAGNGTDVSILLACKNGGVRVLGEEECQCPAGFTGSQCEEGCGPNSYGMDCGGRCTGFERGCHKMIFCRKYLPCMCAPGFEGQFCDTNCSPGQYGASCRMTCGYCSTGECNIYTGECTDACKPGYHPPLCQDKYTTLAQPPTVRYNDLLSVILGGNISAVFGQGTPKYFQAQYRERNASIWTEAQPHLLNGSTFEIILKDLKPGPNFGRIILIDEDGNSNQGNDVPIVAFDALCRVPSSNEYHLEKENITSSGFSIKWKYDQFAPGWCPAIGFEVFLRSKWDGPRYNLSSEERFVTFTDLLAGEQYSVTVRALTEYGYAPYSPVLVIKTGDRAPGAVLKLEAKPKSVGELLVSWKKPRISGGVIQRYHIEYQCLKFLACNASCSNSTGHVTVLEESVLLTELYPLAQYLVRVAAMSAVLGPYKSIFIATDHTGPRVAPDPSPEPILLRTNTSIAVQWRPPSNCSGLGGYHYGYQYELVSNEEVLQKGTTFDTYVNITDLSPHTPYHVWVYVVTSGGWSRLHKLVISADTSATVSEQVEDLSIYKKGRYTVGLRWAGPHHTYGSIKSFTVGYQESGSANSTRVSETIAPVHCTAWPELYCHTVKDLKPDTFYEIMVQVRNTEVNSDSAPSIITAVTREAAPDAPTSLQVTNRSQTGMMIQWGPPRLINGVLRSFILNVEETGSSNSSTCCQYFPIQELPIQTEQQMYQLQVGGLKPASTFTFSISAKTVSLGPSLNITASTPPDTPTEISPPEMVSSPEAGHTFTAQVKPSGSYSGLKSTYLFMIVTYDIEEQKVIFWDTELQTQLQQLVNETFYVVSEFPEGTLTEEKTVTFGTGALRRNGSLSFLEDPIFKPGSYRLGLALVLEYCEAKSVGFASGEVFTIT